MLRTLWFVLTVLALPAIAQQSPVNLNFEAGSVGEYPTGWVSSKNPASGYSIVTVEGNAKEGNRFATIRSNDQPSENQFGTLMQFVKAEGYQNKIVRFRAAVRVDGDAGPGRGQLWLRVDRAN